MIRKSALAVGLLTATALVAAACTPGTGPAPVTWKVRPDSIKVLQSEDNDTGDEPYVIQVGFRSKLGVSKSSSVQVASQCRSGQLTPIDAGVIGTTVAIPAGSADITFGGVQNLDIGDVVLNTAPLEILGTISFAAERDAPFSSCLLTDAFDQIFSGVLTDALNLLIADSTVPPTQDALVKLLTDNISNVLSGVFTLLGTILEGFGNPDDIVGVAAQILLPTSGTFAGLLDAGLAIGGIFQPGLETGILPIDSTGIRIRVGNLQPSSTTFTLENKYIAKYEYTSSVIGG